jgi:site-specific DNA-adenine methylase
MGKQAPKKRAAVKASTFRYPGGKAMFAAEIIKHIPRSGGKFIDLFAGRGNVFFRAAVEKLDYREWILNDSLTRPFLQAIHEIGDQVKFPDRTSEEFKKQRDLAKAGDQRAMLSGSINYRRPSDATQLREEFEVSACDYAGETASDHVTRLA